MSEVIISEGEQPPSQQSIVMSQQGHPFMTGVFSWARDAIGLALEQRRASVDERYETLYPTKSLDELSVVEQSMILATYARHGRRKGC